MSKKGTALQKDVPWRASSTKPIPRIHQSPVLRVSQTSHSNYALSIMKAISSPLLSSPIHPNPIGSGLAAGAIVEAAGPDCIIPGQIPPVKLLDVKVWPINVDLKFVEPIQKELKSLGKSGKCGSYELPTLRSSTSQAFYNYVLFGCPDEREFDYDEGGEKGPTSAAAQQARDPPSTDGGWPSKRTGCEKMGKNQSTETAPISSGEARKHSSTVSEEIDAATATIFLKGNTLTCDAEVPEANGADPPDLKQEDKSVCLERKILLLVLMDEKPCERKIAKLCRVPIRLSKEEIMRDMSEIFRFKRRGRLKTSQKFDSLAPGA
ncbi:hypothetical protein SAY87_022689 [Trapa incisa]|uniref:Uncharacterized protein n=1 Tax=Trapa incisa TaxID=236973 RepID=A0AAN7Q532_9MYRT|nr:hypothetical protein SAY87_022689 [Trapa incisa]